MAMKTFLASVMLLFFMAIPVFAQDQQASAEDIAAKLESKLNLTQDQVTAITPIIEKYSSKRQGLRQSMEDGTSDPDTIHAQIKQLKQDEKQELSQVLSADQLALWEQVQGQMHKHHSQEGGNGS